MTNSDNPFNNLLEVFKGGEKSPSFLIGRVQTANPLTVETGGVVLARGNLKINAMLLAGYKREVRMDSGSRTMTTVDGLTAGDEVVLLPSTDGQQFVLLCKVV